MSVFVEARRPLFPEPQICSPLPIMALDPSSAHHAAISGPQQTDPRLTCSPPASSGCSKVVALATISFQLKQKLPTTVCDGE